MKNNLILENEVLDDLQYKDLKIIQNRDGYCFTSDAVLLANFIKVKNNQKCVEIGSGSGIISILVSAKNDAKDIICFEIQKRLADMSTRSIEYNNLQDKIKVINDSVTNYKEYIDNQVDVVYCNPPYRKVNNYISKLNDEKDICKFEKTISLKQICQVASKLLKDKGKFYIVYDAKRLAELIYELKLNKLEPKKMFLTQASENQNPILCLIECIKNGNEGIDVLPTLITNDSDGKYIQTIQKIYKEK